jgi:hypothetical protein
MANTDFNSSVPTKEEYAKFVASLDKSQAPKHDRVMRRTYPEKNSDIVTYALIWKNPKFSNQSTAPYIVIDIHYKKNERESGYIGGVFAKGVHNTELKPETDGLHSRTKTPLRPARPGAGPFCTNAPKWRTNHDRLRLGASIDRWPDACGPGTRHYTRPVQPRSTVPRSPNSDA